MVGDAGVVVVSVPVQLPVAVRAWAPRDGRSRPKKSFQFTDLGPSAWSLTFDTETTLDPGQALRVGAFQLRRGRRLAQEGLFYEPDAINETERQLLEQYAAVEGLALMTRTEFVEQVFLRTAWDRRGLIVGHNLPFDLARISIGHHPPQSRGARLRGGFSFKLTENEKASRVQVKKLNAGASLISLTIPAGINPEARNRKRGGQQQNHHGYFLDTATLGGAMLGGRLSLDKLARLVGAEHRKLEAEHGEQITPGYLGYLRADVLVTWESWQALQERYAAYGLPVEPWKIYSEASIGKAHMSKMGLTPFEQLNDWPPKVSATVMETYYGGRAECQIRRQPVPGAYVDFASQYPTVFALQGLSSYITAKKTSHHDEDPGRVQHVLDELTVDQVLDPSLWQTELNALVLIEPDGDRLPTRAKYNRGSDRPGGRAGSYNLGMPYRHGGPAQWYTMADACSSKLMTGKAPQVIKVLRFIAEGVQGGIEPVAIAGNPDYTVNAAEEDFIRRLVELRIDVRADLKAAKTAGDSSKSATLEATQQAMKITANATSYGATIELNPQEHRKGTHVTVHLPNGDRYQLRLDRTEEPGNWFHPLIATLVTSAGRLLLAAAMRLLDDHGGSYAFCDTDSLFIVSTQQGTLIPCLGGQHNTPTGAAAIKAMTRAEVDQIVERFIALDPYHRDGPPQPILELERENYDPDTGERREVECYAIAAKRYGLFTRLPDGSPKLVTSGDKLKRSEHGLGHLLPPNRPSLGASKQDWLDQWWEHLLHLELGVEDHPEPVWFDEPAVGRLTVTSQRDIKSFATYNADKSYAEQVKPWNFLVVAHPAPYERATGLKTLIGPFERDPIKRRAGLWLDRDNPTEPPRHIYTAQTPVQQPRRTAVLSYRDYFNQYRQHAEAKAIDPTDSKRCHPWTRGQLQPWHVTSTEQVRVGKESNRLTDSHGPSQDDEQIEEYVTERHCRGCGESIRGRRNWCSDVCRKRHSRRQKPSKANGLASPVIGRGDDPPRTLLWHGTALANLPSILEHGLSPQFSEDKRFVYLTDTKRYATRVGMRAGVALLLRINPQGLRLVDAPCYDSTIEEYLCRAVVPAEHIYDWEIVGPSGVIREKPGTSLKLKGDKRRTTRPARTDLLPDSDLNRTGRATRP